MTERVGQAGYTLEIAGYTTPEEAASIKGIENEIEGLTVRIDSNTPDRLPNDNVLVIFTLRDEVLWPSVWKAVSDRLAQGTKFSP